MNRTVLFAGGPLHGKTMVTDSTMGVYAMPDYPVSPLDPEAMSRVMLEPVLYHVAKFAMCGRIVWIGHLGSEPDENLAFEVLTSDGAKAASTVAADAF